MSSSQFNSDAYGILNYFFTTDRCVQCDCILLLLLLLLLWQYPLKEFNNIRMYSDMISRRE